MAVAQRLADSNNYEPSRWWVEFSPGSITLDSLIEISRDVDGAVFLFTADDTLWYRQTEVSSARDNVMLEYGVFVNSLGREKTLIITESGVKLPSDISSVTSMKLDADKESVAEKVIAHFDAYFERYRPPRLDGIPLVFDPEVVAHQIASTLPSNWRERTFYFGTEGAKAWLAVAHDKGYSSTPELQPLITKARIESVSNVDARTFVSLGPGDGEIDKALVMALKGKDKGLQYIPVDISDGLLQRAVKLLGEHVRVPVGILSDFEDNVPFIARQMDNFRVRPMIVSLVGYTFGNLDKLETNFLLNIHGLLRNDDYLLFDVTLCGDKWSEESEERLQPAHYSYSYRRFIAHDVSRRTGESIDAVMKSFNRRIRYGLRTTGSDVPNTRTIFIEDNRRGGDAVVGILRRYDWDSLVEWVKRDGKFSIVSSSAHYANSQIEGKGVLLLKRVK